MIDLHTHTIYSDGTWSVERLLSEAEKAKIEVLSITDHDSIDGYKDVLKYRTLFSGKIISGVELNVIYNGVKFELLGYDFDLNLLSSYIDRQYKNKKIDLDMEFNMMIKACRDHNIKIDDLVYEDGKWPIDIIYPSIVSYPENRAYFNDEVWNDKTKFFHACTSDCDFPVYMDFSIHYPNALDVAREIRSAGGIVFVAHLYRYKINNHLEFLNTLYKDGVIDGVEAYHSSFDANETKTLLNYAALNKLKVSGGSDCHGDKKPSRKIGVGYDNLNIPRVILSNWLKGRE